MDHHTGEIAAADEHPFRGDVAEQEVVHADDRRGRCERAPVAQQHQRGQADEEVHVAFHLPGMAGHHVDEQRGLNGGHGSEREPDLKVVAPLQGIVARQEVDRRGQQNARRCMPEVEHQREEQQRHGTAPAERGEQQNPAHTQLL
jgi:hypothetical protein